ncbi:hypothetical protein [Xylella fastidiosa]|uniref:hypothetical protein n=1 Tax=Xylella fastidiosa TaxID=2371 RepID=UPI003AFB4744
MWSALIPGAASLIGSLIQGNAAKRAGNAQARASQEAIAEQQRQYNQARQDQLPWLTAGQNALTGQQAVLSGDYSGFEKAPDYTYALDQGLRRLGPQPPPVAPCRRPSSRCNEIRPRLASRTE